MLGKNIFCSVQYDRFTKIRDAYFDVTSESAVGDILADVRKTLPAREEDAEFVRRLRRNEFVRFGSRDWSQQQRFDRTAAREEEKQKRAEKEATRKEASICIALSRNCTLMEVISDNFEFTPNLY